MPAVRHAFDDVAPRYDAAFTNVQLGRWLRSVVWRELDSAFMPGDRVLDAGCGTGEDACHLAGRGVDVIATDASTGMLEVTRAKAELRGLAGRVMVRPLDLVELAGGRGTAELALSEPLDGAYSNFGPLNCLADRALLAQELASMIKPGGKFVAVVMGPICPWETGWYLLHGHPRTAIRRFRRGVSSRVGDIDIRVWYPSPRRLRAEFSPHFAHVKTIGIGICLPPSDFGSLVSRAPTLFERLNAFDDRIRKSLPGRWLCDHYLSVFSRRDEAETW